MKFFKSDEQIPLSYQVIEVAYNSIMITTYTNNIRTLIQQFDLNCLCDNLKFFNNHRWFYSRNKEKINKLYEILTKLQGNIATFDQNSEIQKSNILDLLCTDLYPRFRELQHNFKSESDPQSILFNPVN